MVPETPDRIMDSTRPSHPARTMADTGSVTVEPAATVSAEDVTGATPAMSVTAAVPASAAVMATVPVTSYQVPPHPPESRIELPEPETTQPYRLCALPSGMVPPDATVVPPGLERKAPPSMETTP